MNENARDSAPRRDRVDVRITGLQQEDFQRLFETATRSSRLQAARAAWAHRSSPDPRTVRVPTRP